MIMNLEFHCRIEQVNLPRKTQRSQIKAFVSLVPQIAGIFFSNDIISNAKKVTARKICEREIECQGSHPKWKQTDKKKDFIVDRRDVNVNIINNVIFLWIYSKTLRVFKFTFFSWPSLSTLFENKKRLRQILFWKFFSIFFIELFFKGWPS